MWSIQTAALLAVLLDRSWSWAPSLHKSGQRTTLQMKESDSDGVSNRRSFLSTVAAVGTVVSRFSSNAIAADDEDFKSIAERAAKISKEMQQAEEVPATNVKTQDSRTAYDFSLPVAGTSTQFQDLIVRNEKTPKAVLVVNIKQDDPIARKNIPEMIALAAKYGRSGDLVVIACPTDQGYYEPDTSALIRLKLASEYGYGINPATVLTDKVNLLGSGAHPFWRWLEGTCRTPAGLGRIQGNFEKFLLDGNGIPLRRYPRKYQPADITDDIEAVIAGKPLPPAAFNFREEWRSAAVDADRDTYRFQKGLNYFDQ